MQTLFYTPDVVRFWEKCETLNRPAFPGKKFVCFCWVNLVAEYPNHNVDLLWDAFYAFSVNR